jgi:UDP-N-acetylmuramoyl-tripeptide--D-alanyl-D-alanine ligase
LIADFRLSIFDFDRQSTNACSADLFFKVCGFWQPTMRLCIGKIANILGSSTTVADQVVDHYSIDSRTTDPQSLFFAIRGPRFDGHDFVVQAFDRGAVAAVVEQRFLSRSSEALRRALIPVPDTALALQQLARAVRRKWGRRLIAVTGSTGKTTTKELLAALLATRFAVHRSAGNLNNLYGVPLALLALEPGHEVAVLELAMSAHGEIARLARMAEPDVGVVTNVGPVHLEFFDSVDSIARAKRELIENLKPPATAVLNFDDPWVRSFAEGFQGRTVTFGFGDGAQVQGLDWQDAGPAGSRLRVGRPTMECDFELHLPGRHNAENLLAALAATSLFGIPPADLQRAVASFHGLDHRSEVVELPGGAVLLDDSYNSNPLAMEKMLETLAAWPGTHRRIIVAGEMQELGVTSPDLHRAVGRKCAALGADWLLAVQGNARYFLEGAVEGGMPHERMQFFSTAQEAAEFCRAIIRPGDLVLVKGSRGVALERVVEVLREQSPLSVVSGPLSVAS